MRAKEKDTTKKREKVLGKAPRQVEEPLEWSWMTTCCLLCL